jgi:HEAT repeat protein
VLGKNLKSDSPRVQRVAASALARTGNTDAIGELVAALGKETSDIAKLEIAYAIARGGDKRGTDALVAALAAPRRDVRLEAARRLALLGDKRATPVLTEYLDVSQLRLGAAEQLAYLADPAGLKALDAVRADPKATHDEQARATIALGHAGRKDLIPALEQLLTEKGNDAFAAAALAELHDMKARPVLEQQLSRPTRRAESARALRRLDPGLDPGPLLPPLLAALQSAKDTEQVEAAEAVLLLAGPATWATHE